MNKPNFIILQTAFQSLLKQKVRAILTILAISIGISAVIVVFAAGHSLDGMIKGQLDVFGTDIIEVEVKVPSVGKTSNENAMGMAQGITITTFKNKDLEVIKKNKNISAVYGAVMGQEVVSYEDTLKKVFLMGVSSKALEVDGTEVLLGRFFTEEEDLSLSQVAVLGYKTWKNIFDDQNPVGRNISIKGKKFKVVGVLAERGAAFMMDMDSNIYVPLETMQKRILGTDYMSFAVAKMIDPSLSKKTQEDLTYALREQHDITDLDKDDFAVNTMDEAQEMLGSIVDGIMALLVSLVGISLLVGGVGIMNIMYVSVTERTFEIGLRKSLGAKNKNILWQFLYEAVMITLGGGIAGVIIGAILAYVLKVLAVTYGLDWEYYIPPFSILVSVGFSMIIGFIFGIYPARKAARMNPIQALGKE